MTILAADFFGREALQDPYPLYDRMRAESFVHRIGGSAFYAVCGWDALIEAITRSEDFSSNLTATAVYREDGAVTEFHMGEPGADMHALATADDPAHALHRKILLPHLSARRIHVIEEYAAQTAGRLWEENLSDGRIEWMSGIANRLPMIVVAKLLGLPDTDVDDLIRLGYATTTLLDGIVTTAQLAAGGAAALELSAYVATHFEKASTAGESGLIAGLAARYAAGEVTQMAAMTMMITLFSAAGESTASLLGSAAWILAERPQLQQRVRDRPELLNAFIEEVLRYEPPFRGHYRHVWRDTTLGGVTVPANSHLLLLWGAANRDPAQFEAPNEFRLDRSGGKSHVAFGRGVHFCVGAALARLEAQIVFRMLLDRTSWIEVVDVGDWLPSVLVRRLDRLQLAVR